MVDQLTFDEETHIYRMGERRLPSVTGIIQAVNLIDTRFYTEEGRHRGSMVHLACQFYDEGDLNEDELDPAIVPYLEAWKDFCAQGEWEFDHIEEKYASKLGFAGTMDRVSMDPVSGKATILDIKTGALNWQIGLQLSAYQILFEENTGIKVVKRIAVRLKKDGTSSTEIYKDRTDKTLFMGALSIVNARINNNEFWEKIS